MNRIILVGRIKEINGENVILSVPSEEKNENGEYTYDDIPCHLNFINKVQTYCKVGDIIALHGKLKHFDNEYFVFAEKVSFLKSNVSEKEVEQEHELS